MSAPPLESGARGTTPPGPSLDTLERTFERVPRFLRAISVHPSIATALAEKGYTTADHQEGWSLFAEVLGQADLPGVIFRGGPAIAALAALEAWRKSGYAVAAVTLRRRYADQHTYLFGGLKSAPGAAWVVAVDTLLSRIDTLPDDPDRVESRDADLAALALLELRGLTPAVRVGLRAHVAAAQTPAPLVMAGGDREAARWAAMQALHGWYDEWADIARSVVVGRRDLIRLGLARLNRPRAA